MKKDDVIDDWAAWYKFSGSCMCLCSLCSEGGAVFKKAELKGEGRAESKVGGRGSESLKLMFVFLGYHG